MAGKLASWAETGPGVRISKYAFAPICPHLNLFGVPSAAEPTIPAGCAQLNCGKPAPPSPRTSKACGPVSRLPASPLPPSAYISPPSPDSIFSTFFRPQPLSLLSPQSCSFLRPVLHPDTQIPLLSRLQALTSPQALSSPHIQTHLHFPPLQRLSVQPHAARVLLGASPLHGG